jgi:predicted site-specific integrase-resolvase
MVQTVPYLREVTHEIPNCVSPTEACRRLSISRSTLDRLCAQRRLQKIRVSDGRVGITIESIAHHLAALNGSPETAAASEPRISRRKRELQARSAARRAQRVRSAA